MKTAKDYLTKEYDIKHIQNVVEMCDYTSLFGLIQEYANERAKQAVELALQVVAEKATVIYHDGTTKEETVHLQCNVGNNHIKPNRIAILSCKEEILRQLNIQP